MTKEIDKVITNAEVILVLAGAGMSVDSNLPTYRGKEGFWNAYPLYKDLQKNYASMMSSNGLMSDPHFAWGFFAHQHRLYKNAVPHTGYDHLLELCKSKKDYFVVTTNVDGLFLKAGFPKDQLHEAHGTIHALQCTIPCCRETWAVDNLCVEVDYATMRALEPLPLCPHCGAITRPHIYLFGDTNETYVWEEAQYSAKKFREWKDRNKNKKILILEIGVGVDGLKRHAKQYLNEFSDATLVRINPEYDSTYDKKIRQIQMGCKEFFDAFM